MYGKMGQLSPSITSITEKYKTGKCKTVMMLQFSNEIEKFVTILVIHEHIESGKQRQQLIMPLTV